MSTRTPDLNLRATSRPLAIRQCALRRGLSFHFVASASWLAAGCSADVAAVLAVERSQGQQVSDAGPLHRDEDVERWRVAPEASRIVGLTLGRYDISTTIDLSEYSPSSGPSPCAFVFLRFPAPPFDSGYSESLGCAAERFDEVLEGGLVRSLFTTDNSNAGMNCLIFDVWDSSTESPEPRLQCNYLGFRDPMITMGGQIGGGGMAVPSLYPRSLQVGHNSACLLTEEGHPICYGFGPDHRPVATEVFESLASTGPGLACGLRADGTVRCWGREAEGELAAPPGQYIEQCAGPYHWCGLTADGRVRCLGEDLYGETEVPEGPVYGALACNLESTCVAEVGGGVACYGRFANDLLRPPEGLQAWRLAVNVRNACALLKDGGLQCWGDYDLHRDANGTWTPELAPPPARF